MGLNRILMKANGSTIEGDGEFIMTMGQQGAQYGYSRYNATFGEVEGSVKHDGKAVTLVMAAYYGGWFDFAFNVAGVTSGKYNVTVKVTSTGTNENVCINFSSIQYQSYVPGFYEYSKDLPAEVATMFAAANVGKKFKVEIVFN
jgi:hypothetical protein